MKRYFTEGWLYFHDLEFVKPLKSICLFYLCNTLYIWSVPDILLIQLIYIYIYWWIPVRVIVWQHHLVSCEILREKARWEQSKKITFCFFQRIFFLKIMTRILITSYVRLNYWRFIKICGSNKNGSVFSHFCPLLYIYTYN